MIVPLLRAQHDVVVGALVEAAHRQRRAHALALGELEHVHERLAARGASELRQLVDLQPVHAAAGGEEQDVGVGRGDEEALDEVLLARLHALHALAAAALRAVLA